MNRAPTQPIGSQPPAQPRVNRPRPPLRLSDRACPVRQSRVALLYPAGGAGNRGKLTIEPARSYRSSRSRWCAPRAHPARSGRRTGVGGEQMSPATAWPSTAPWHGGPGGCRRLRFGHRFRPDLAAQADVAGYSLAVASRSSGVACGYRRLRLGRSSSPSSGDPGGCRGLQLSRRLTVVWRRLRISPATAWASTSPWSGGPGGCRRRRLSRRLHRGLAARADVAGDGLAVAFTVVWQRRLMAPATA
jgi:hypothetical protein